MLQAHICDLVDSKEYLIGVSVGTEEFALGRLKCVAIVVDRSILGGDEGLWSFLSGGSFEGASDDKLEGAGNGEGDILGFIK